MRLRASVLRLALVGVLVGVLAAASPAGDAELDLRLNSGASFTGTIAAHDDDGFTLRRTGGGEFRVLWRDLDEASFVTARRTLTDPRDAAALLALAQRAAAAGERRLAESLRADVVRAEPARAATLGELDAAITALRRTEAEALVQRGKERLEDEDWLQALGRFRDAAALEPGLASATNGIGEAYYYLRRLRESRDAFDAALRIDPACKDALLNVSFLDLLELDFEGCLAGLDRLLKLPPEAGRVGSREEFAKRWQAQTEPRLRAEDAWQQWVDQPLVQAADLRPVIAGIVAGPGFAQEFVRETEHYRVRTNVSQDCADVMAERLELIHTEYERQFSFQKTGKTQTRGRKLVHPVIVFATREQYAEWFTRVLRDPRLAAATGGVYVSLVKHLVFFQGKTFEDTQLVAWHEAFHQYLDHYIDRAPHWFNEGQAEYFGSSRLREGRKRVDVGGTNPWRVGELSQMLAKQRLPLAADLMRLDAATFMGGPTSGTSDRLVNTPVENYAASWALVHFLIEGQKGRHESLLLAYFKALADGQSHQEAFEKAFGRVKWAAFDAAWRAHCVWLVERARAEQDGRDPPPPPR